MYQTPSRIQDVHTYATFPPMDSINQSTVASSGWFIGMILALLFLIAVCVTVCLIKRNRSVTNQRPVFMSRDITWPIRRDITCNYVSRLQFVYSNTIHYAGLSAELDTASCLHTVDLFPSQLASNCFNICCTYNPFSLYRGGKYAVQEQEVAHGRGVDYDDGGGFMEYTQP